MHVLWGLHACICPGAGPAATICAFPCTCSSLGHPGQHPSWNTSRHPAHGCWGRLRACRTSTLYDCPLQGKYVVLFFYPLDFTFVCPTEITAFSDRHGDFEKVNAEVGLEGSAVCACWLGQLLVRLSTLLGLV